VYALVRPLLFALDPAIAHGLGMAALAPLEFVSPLRWAARALLSVRRPRLASETMGLTFPSPLGVAAGFDKNGQRARALAALGFGHIELGTVTAIAQEQNPQPNLFRLERDSAIINRLGFPNEGAAALVARLARRGGTRAVGVPVGISIGKSRVIGIDPIEPAVADYLASFQVVRGIADFVVVNVSSPNTKDLRTLQTADLARTLLSALRGENESGARRVPLLVKIAPDLEDAALGALLDVAKELGLDGVVATNTTLSRKGLVDARAAESAGAGGLSGPPLRERALHVVRVARQHLGKSATVIGVGGIETAEHALRFVRAGANLVQLYTGFIYRGPFVAEAIARQLDRELARLGVTKIADLVGVDA
jgi:dihydroorotate dehydrogenase